MHTLQFGGCWLHDCARLLVNQGGLTLVEEHTVVEGKEGAFPMPLLRSYDVIAWTGFKRGVFIFFKTARPDQGTA